MKKTIWGGEVHTLLRSSDGHVSLVPPHCLLPRGIRDETEASRIEELKIMPLPTIQSELQRRFSTSNFDLATASKCPREFALWFEKDFFHDEKESVRFCFAAKAPTVGKVPEEAYLFPTGYLSACPAIRVTTTEKTTPKTICMEAAIIDCEHVSNFDIQYTVSQSKKQDWARKLLKLALAFLKNAKQPWQASRSTFFKKSNVDDTEKARLIILLYLEYWDSTGPKNAGKEFDLESFGVEITNIRKIIQGMGIERGAKLTIPSLKPAKRSKS